MLVGNFGPTWPYLALQELVDSLDNLSALSARLRRGADQRRTSSKVAVGGQHLLDLRYLGPDASPHAAGEPPREGQALGVPERDAARCRGLRVNGCASP